MNKKLFLGLIAVTFVILAGAVLAQGGFDEFGYNRKARVFVGTGWSWCMGKVGDETWCENYLGPYTDDTLIMKWNAEWDRGNDEGWSDPDGYHGAWCNNVWNGKAGGTEETWYYMNRWIGPCGDYGDPTPNGGYCIWGQFEVTLSHGTYPEDGNIVHLWDAHAIPAGVGP